MSTLIIAPCGVICDICLGFQRKKNSCVGCLAIGNKPYHCMVCTIKSCVNKKGDENLLCNECEKFPCRRIKDLDKRYVTKYGESPIENLNRVKDMGLEKFSGIELKKWKCKKCGELLCVHREFCLVCESGNDFFPHS